MTENIQEKQIVPLFDDKGFVHTSALPRQQKLDIDLNFIPVDAWNSIHWKKFISNLYESFFLRKFPFDTRSFNIGFCELKDYAFEEYSMTNEELKEFFYFVYQDYFPFLKSINTPFSFRTLKNVSLNKFYSQRIEPIRETERFLNKNLRGIQLHQDTLFFDIGISIKNMDHLIRQLGIPVMQYVLLEGFQKDPDNVHKIIYNSIRDRLKFELEYRKHETKYLENVVWNSIYWGQYPFTVEFRKAKFPNWREFLEKPIEAFKIKEKSWWIDKDFCRRKTLSPLLSLKKDIRNERKQKIKKIKIVKSTSS